MTSKPSAIRRYCAIFLPLLSADRWLRERSSPSLLGEGDHPKGGGGVVPRPIPLQHASHGPPPPDKLGEDIPLVFIEKQRGAMRLVAVGEAAAALGIAPGMTLADARARVPDLVTAPFDAQANAALLEEIADDCDRYTPSVAIDPPDGLILDITGCAPVWNGEEELVGALAARLVDAGFTIRIALAETPDKARALARHGGELIGAGRRTPPGRVNEERATFAIPPTHLPIAALDPDPDQALALRRAGLTRIGDLASRPRRPLAARFGMALVSKLARVLGEEDVRITPRRALPALFFVRRFAEPIAHSDLMLAAIRDLAGEAQTALGERGEGGRRFSVGLFRSDGDIRRLTIATGAPTRDPKLLDRLFRERIDSLSDPLDPGFGYDAIRFDVADTQTLDPTQIATGGEAQPSEDASALIDRLAVRLGPNRVRRFVPGNSHIPELAGLTMASSAPPLPFAWPEPEPGEPPLRPLRMFDPPQLIEVTAEVPDGPPMNFRWRRRLYRIARAEGPERIASEWWRRKRGYEPGQGGLTRDYFRVEDDTGHRFWLFRHGLYGAEKTHPDWYLHGCFA